MAKLPSPRRGRKGSAHSVRRGDVFEDYVKRDLELWIKRWINFTQICGSQPKSFPLVSKIPI
jgi:hypothetical protein